MRKQLQKRREERARSKSVADTPTQENFSEIDEVEGLEEQHSPEPSKPEDFGQISSQEAILEVLHAPEPVAAAPEPVVDEFEDAETEPEPAVDEFEDAETDPEPIEDALEEPEPEPQPVKITPKAAEKPVVQPPPAPKTVEKAILVPVERPSSTRTTTESSSDTLKLRRVVVPAWQANEPKPVSKPEAAPVVGKLRTYDADDLLSPRMKAKKALTQSLGDKLAEKFAPKPVPVPAPKPTYDEDDEDDDDLEDLDEDFDDSDFDDDDEESLGTCLTCPREAIITLFGKNYCEKCAPIRAMKKPAVVVEDSSEKITVVQTRTEAPHPPHTNIVTEEVAEIVPLAQVSPVSTPESVVRRFLDGRNQNTLNAYQRDLDAFTTFMGEISREKAVASLFSRSAPEANALVLDWMNSMKNTGLSSATVARRVATLRSMGKVARLLGAISWKLEVEAPKVEPYKDTRGPSVSQLGKLLRATDQTGEKGVRDRALLLTAIGLGLRRAELASLRRKDYDYDNKRLFVRGKGSKNLWLTVPDKVCEALDDWLQVRPESNEEAPLICSLDYASDGQALTPAGVYYIITTLGKKAGITVKPHGLRHAAITMGLEATGGDYRKVQRFSRHANPKTLLKYDDNRQDLGAVVANAVLDRLDQEDEEEESDE